MIEKIMAPESEAMIFCFYGVSFAYTPSRNCMGLQSFVYLTM